MKFFKLTICVSIFLFSAVFFAHSASAADVFYSVGQNATDHSSGGNVSITSGVATFTVAQVATNLGVGDRLTAGGNVYYLSTKTSTTVWNVVTALGAVPADLGSTAVTSIAHEYTTLSAAEAGAADANHLNTTDLTSGGGYILNLPCYYDTGADTTAVTVDGWTTGASNYIKIYTPNNTATEANQSQRHSGKWDTGKYRLEPTSYAHTIVNNEAYTRFEGLQVSATTNTSSYLEAFNSTGGNAQISNNIIKGYGSNTSRRGIFLGSTGGNYVWNNIIYDFAGTSSFGIGASGSAVDYYYNNTVYGCEIGIELVYELTVVKNNISYGNNNNYDGAAATDSTNNLSGPSQSDAPGNNPQNTKTVSFLSTTASSEDFHLSSLDGAAKNFGVDLTNDANLAFSNDIDGYVRNQVWDIGADEVGGNTRVIFTPDPGQETDFGAATAIYRSVGPGNTTALAVGTSNALTISGSTATFAAPLPDRVGVGDALQYDDDNDSDIDASDSIVFIHARTNSKTFTVKTASGAAPTAVASDNNWSLFRAYTSLSLAEEGTENTGIDSDLRDFDTLGKDLTSSNEVWNITAYGDAADTTTTVTIDGWTTDADNFIRIYTPVSKQEVGVSQRHQGKWDVGKYRMLATTRNFTIPENFVRIDGLQLARSTDADDLSVFYTGTGGLHLSNSLVVSTAATRTVGTGIYIGTGNISSHSYIFNNIVNNIQWGIVVRAGADDGRAYVYSNTVYGCTTGIRSRGAYNYAKNNLVIGCTDAFLESTAFVVADYNAYDEGTDPGTNGVDLSASADSAIFVDAANEDFHLVAGSPAIGVGTDTSGESSPLNFTTDIDGQARVDSWDIGADERPANTVIKGGVKIIK